MLPLRLIMSIAPTLPCMAHTTLKHSKDNSEGSFALLLQICALLDP